MYAESGEMWLKANQMFGVDLLTSKGQTGGALTDKETGTVYGIYCGTDTHE